VLLLLLPTAATHLKAAAAQT